MEEGARSHQIRPVVVWKEQLSHLATTFLLELFLKMTQLLLRIGRQVLECGLQSSSQLSVSQSESAVCIYFLGSS